MNFLDVASIAVVICTVVEEVAAYCVEGVLLVGAVVVANGNLVDEGDVVVVADMD